MDIHELLKLQVEKGASDLHLRVPSPPVLRIDGRLKVMDNLPPVKGEEIEEALDTVTDRLQMETFRRELEIELAYSIPGLARFRVAAYYQRGTISMTFRQVPFQVPSIEEFGLPEVCRALVHKDRGLVLVTGPAGSGKSTTLAAMINHLNRTEAKNIITIEDPIEFLYKNERCLIAQRDLGDDTKSFSTALKHILRQDPDVILVGEMRDLETMAAAITAAETGHLVLSTLHTVSAGQTIDRIIDIFPATQQSQIRFQLSMTLQGVLSQTLLPRTGGKGRIAAFEVMLVTDAIRNLIREGRTEQLNTYIQTGRQFGMQTMDQALQDLVRTSLVPTEEALIRATKPEELQRIRA